MTPLGPTWRKSSHSRRENNCLEAAWHKSTHSQRQNNCLEAAWQKSSHSERENNCLKAAAPTGTVLVRDSKLGDASPVLRFSPTAWNALLAALTR